MQIYTDAAQAALRQAKRISGQMKHPYTGTEHILLGLLREQESTAGQVLINAGVTEAGLTDMISQLIAARKAGCFRRKAEALLRGPERFWMMHRWKHIGFMRDWWEPSIF